MTNDGGRTGRRPRGDGGNRERILAAARAEFGTRGFRATTMRAIAARAGVDVALIAHYYGNKDGLFAATVELPAQARSLLAEALSAPVETQGERLTRAYLGLWEDPTTSAQMQVLTRSALTNEAASARMRTLVTGTIGDPGVGQLLTGRGTGFALAMSQLLGLALARYLVGLPAVATVDLDTLVGRVAPVVQAHLSAQDD